MAEKVVAPPVASASARWAVGEVGAGPSVMQTSVQESLPRVGLILGVVAVVVMLVFAAKVTIFEVPGTTAANVANRFLLVRPEPTATLAAPAAAPVGESVVVTVVVTATPVPTVAATATPVIIVREVPGPVVVEYIRIPVEVPVEVVVEVTAVPLPTLTPVPLVTGTVKICVDGAGLKAIYVDGQGIVGGGCQIWQVGVGASYITVQINR